MSVIFDDAVLFDEAAHRYTHDFTDYPSVTTVLKPWSPISKLPEHVLEYGRERGELVHLATALDDQGILNEDQLEPEVMAFVEGWRKFRRDWNYTPTMIERRFVHTRWGYAGTMDRFGHGVHPKKKKTMHIPLDIKTGVADPTHGPQVAAYAQPLSDTKHRIDLRLTVYLKPGSYEVDEHTSLHDWTIFVAALQWHQWRKTHNL